MAISADLGSKLETFVGDLVSSGRYNSKSEVLREGVRLLQEKELRLAALDMQVVQGIADLEAGRIKPLEAVAERLERRFGGTASPEA